ncbi:MAG: TAXI family TRAP transporter solute-binding subunit [Dehalococcoidales bacterium]|nr:TAXI family TRAP transporter solute-binding subunit [Dehalococcoidales bacterium]
MKNRIALYLMIGLLLVAVMVTACSKPASAPQPGSTEGPKTKLYFGSTTSTSSAYVFGVAVTRVANKYAPGVSVTLVESGGSVDNSRKIMEGVFDAGTADGWNIAYELMRGIDTFQGKPWPNIRIFFMRGITVIRLFVKADSKYKTWADLAGKRVSSGIPGSSADARIRQINELLGTKADIVGLDYNAATEQLQTGRLDAVYKSSPDHLIDAGMLAAHQLTPLRVIGWTKEEAAKLNAKYPQFMLRETPTGYIKELPSLPPMYENYSFAVVTTSARLPQEIGYRIMKAEYEHWDEVRAPYPDSAENPIKDFLAKMTPDVAVPFAAGTVQYAKEKGITIPDFMIPPDYKAK